MWDWGVAVKVFQSKFQHAVHTRQLHGVSKRSLGPPHPGKVVEEREKVD